MTAVTQGPTSELDVPYEGLPPTATADFNRNDFVHLPGVLSPRTIAQYEPTITAEVIRLNIWLPLQETPLDMGPLAFARSSHNFSFGRDLPISDESEAVLKKALAEQEFEDVIEPFTLGDASFHRGWTFHHAGANHGTVPRRVMTVIYMDADIRVAEPVNEPQMRDRSCSATVGRPESREPQHSCFGSGRVGSGVGLLEIVGRRQGSGWRRAGRGGHRRARGLSHQPDPGPAAPRDAALVVSPADQLDHRGR